jgi:hypothetical protein
LKLLYNILPNFSFGIIALLSQFTLLSGLTNLFEEVSVHTLLKMKLSYLLSVLSITGASANRRTDLNDQRREERRLLSLDCFTVIANGVEFNAASAIRRSIRVDTVNEARQCLEFGFEPFIRFGSTYCTGDTFAIGNVRLYDEDEPFGDLSAEEFVAGLCTNYTEDGKLGGYPTPLGVSACPLAELEDRAETSRVGYYSRSGTRVARVVDGLSALPVQLGGDPRNVFDVHSIHTFTFPNAANTFTSQIVAVSLDGTSNGANDSAGGVGSAAIVGGTGDYELARGVVNYKNFRLADANNMFEICLERERDSPGPQKKDAFTRRLNHKEN